MRKDTSVKQTLYTFYSGDNNSDKGAIKEVKI